MLLRLPEQQEFWTEALSISQQAGEGVRWPMQCLEGRGPFWGAAAAVPAGLCKLPAPGGERGPSLGAALCTPAAVTSRRLPGQRLKSRQRGAGCLRHTQPIPTAPCPCACPRLRDRDRSMRLLLEAALLCLTLGLGQCTEEAAQDSTGHQDSQAESSYSDWGIETIRDGFETVNSYFDTFLELLGGKNGVCQYRCRYGK